MTVSLHMKPILIMIPKSGKIRLHYFPDVRTCRVTDGMACPVVIANVILKCYQSPISLCLRKHFQTATGKGNERPRTSFAPTEESLTILSKVRMGPHPRHPPRRACTSLQHHARRRTITTIWRISGRRNASDARRRRRRLALEALPPSRLALPSLFIRGVRDEEFSRAREAPICLPSAAPVTGHLVRVTRLANWLAAAVT